MSEHEFDDLLGQALLRAALADGAALSVQTVEPAFSPPYLRERLRLLANPLAWRRRRARPVWKRALRGAACLLLVCALGLAAVLTVSPHARAAVWQWVMERYGASTSYRFTGTPTHGEMLQYEIGALPDGYQEIDRNEMTISAGISYENAEGNLIHLDYMRMEQGGLIAISTDELLVENVLINGLPGELYLPTDPLDSHVLIWRDASKNLCFSINAISSKLEILHMAESVSLAK